MKGERRGGTRTRGRTYGTQRPRGRLRVHPETHLPRLSMPRRKGSRDRRGGGRRGMTEGRASGASCSTSRAAVWRAIRRLGDVGDRWLQGQQRTASALCPPIGSSHPISDRSSDPSPQSGQLLGPLTKSSPLPHSSPPSADVLVAVLRRSDSQSDSRPPRPRQTVDH